MDRAWFDGVGAFFNDHFVIPLFRCSCAGRYLTLHHDIAAGRTQRLPGEEVRILSSQEHGGGGNVFDLADTAEGISSNDFVADIVGHEIVEIGAYDRRANSVDVNALFADFPRQSTGKSDHASLCR